jgi:hypothetical protein
LIGNLTSHGEQAVILIGEKQTGKTTTLQHALKNKSMVIRISASSARNEQEFGKILMNSMGLWHAPICKQHSSILTHLHCSP